MYISPIFEANESTERIFIKLHGFRDSPISLHNLSSSANVSKVRVSEENFLSVCLEKENLTSFANYSFFNDFNKNYIIEK